MANSFPIQEKGKEDNFAEKEDEYWQKLTEGRVLDLDLFTACAIGDFDCVKSYLSHTNSESDIVNKKNSGGWTPLMYTCYVGHVEILELLIRERADILTKEEKHGTTPLMLASSSGNTSLVKRLVEKGAEINVVDKNGQTALFHATEQGHGHTVTFLLENNADILISQNETGYTPFMEAARQGHEYVFKTFLTHGIDLRLVCNCGLTARDLAFQKESGVIVSMIDNHLNHLRSLRGEPELSFADWVIGDMSQPEQKVNQWLIEYNHGISGKTKCYDDITNQSKLIKIKQSHPVSIDDGFMRNARSDAYGKSFETIVDSDRTPVGTPVDYTFEQYMQAGEAKHYGRYFNNSLPSLEKFLQELNLEKYKKVFDDESVDFRVLISLTEEEFKELGVKLGSRKKLKSAIEKWKIETGRSLEIESSVQELDNLKRQLAEVIDNLKRVNGDFACEQEARSLLEGQQMEERARRNHIYFIGEKIQRSCQELLNYSKNIREHVKAMEMSALATSEKIDKELHAQLKTLHNHMVNDIQNTDSVIDVILRRVKKIMSRGDPREPSSDSDSPESSCTSISKSEGSIDFS